MKDHKVPNDLETCKRKILALLAEYNCSIDTEDYVWVGLRDNDTQETVALKRS